MHACFKGGAATSTHCMQCRGSAWAARPVACRDSHSISTALWGATGRPAARFHVSHDRKGSDPYCPQLDARSTTNAKWSLVIVIRLRDVASQIK